MRNYITMYSLLLLTVSSVALTSCKGKKMEQPEKVFGIASYYQLVLEDSNSNHEKQEVFVIQSLSKLQEIYAQINSTRRPGLKVPEVDFKNETIIIAYGGQQNTGGYYLDITQVEDDEESTHYKFELKKKDGDMATMSITTPVKIISVSNKDKKITASF